MVARRLPRFLAGESQPAIVSGSGRRELAGWVASKKNPLTARVIVNRVWQWHFGEGLVRTPNNFGLRSEPPTHPGLLDWLAARFVADGWSLKKLHRRIMLSAVYQEPVSSDATNSTTIPRIAGSAAFRPVVSRPKTSRRHAVGRGRPLDGTPGGPAGDDLTSGAVALRSNGTLGPEQLATLFDAANPDASVEKRDRQHDCPAIALLFLNHEFVARQANHLAGHLR